MIKTLRLKFILIAMLSLVGTLVILNLAINVTNYIITTKRADRAIQILYHNDGEFPPPSTFQYSGLDGNFRITEETPYETRYFIAYLSDKDEVTHTKTEHIAAVDNKEIVTYIQSMLNKQKKYGYRGHYRYGIFEEEGRKVVIVLDYFLQLQAMRSVWKVSIFVSLLCVLIVFILLLFLSKKAIRPFLENMERQKQFVTNASHELKTPLAIISANNGILEMSVGENEWITSTNKQVMRMNQLIQNLIELAKHEEAAIEEERSIFSVKEIVQSNMEAFKGPAQAKGIEIQLDMSEEVMMKGVSESIFQLVSILLDNAVRYCEENGILIVKLKKKGKTILFSVSNTCKELDHSKTTHFFERFYRLDSSRSRKTGGYGIGLSMARAITERHKGKISVQYHQDKITFVVALPSNNA